MVWVLIPKTLMKLLPPTSAIEVKDFVLYIVCLSVCLTHHDIPGKVHSQLMGVLPSTPAGHHMLLPDHMSWASWNVRHMRWVNAGAFSFDDKVIKVTQLLELPDEKDSAEKQLDNLDNMSMSLYGDHYRWIIGYHKLILLEINQMTIGVFTLG